MRVTVLGKSPAWQDAGGACSGYLVQHAGSNVLLDCGNGAFGKLRLFLDYVDVHAVVISHLHADHILDLIPFSYALIYAPRQQPVPVPPFWAGTDEPAKPRLYAPPGAREVFRTIAGAWGAEDLVERAFELSEYDPATELAIGPLTVRFCEVPHFVLTHAVDFRADDASGRFTFSADLRPADVLPEFARDTDLLVIESTLPRPERTGLRGHLTPGEAGEHGRAANARRLVLTHLSDEMDHEWARGQAEQTFGGPVEVAREGAVYEL